jgi:hypothetical protein
VAVVKSHGPIESVLGVTGVDEPTETVDDPAVVGFPDAARDGWGLPWLLISGSQTAAARNCTAAADATRARMRQEQSHRPIAFPAPPPDYLPERHLKGRVGVYAVAASAQG